MESCIPHLVAVRLGAEGEGDNARRFILPDNHTRICKDMLGSRSGDLVNDFLFAKASYSQRILERREVTRSEGPQAGKCFQDRRPFATRAQLAFGHMRHMRQCGPSFVRCIGR